MSRKQKIIQKALVEYALLLSDLVDHQAQIIDDLESDRNKGMTKVKTNFTKNS